MYWIPPEDRFGSAADLLPDITPTAASGGYPAIQLGILENQILNVCFAQYRTFKSPKYNRNEGQLTAISGRSDYPILMSLRGS